MQITDDLRARFEAKYEKVESGCWLWTASVAAQMGYGQIKLPGERRQIYAHRLSWLIHRGDLPAKIRVLHRCDNPRCVNPDHLWLGTPSDNNQDMKAKDRHRYGERNGKAKLTDQKIREIRQLAGQLSQERIAQLYGVSRVNVHRIIHRMRWTHVE